METMFGDILSQVDSKIIIIAIIAFGISALISFISKAIKLGVTIAVMFMCLIIIAPIAKDFQNKYKFTTNETSIDMVIDGQDITIDKEGIKSISMINKGLSGYNVSISYTDGIISKTIPDFLVSQLKDYLDSHGIKYSETD